MEWLKKILELAADGLPGAAANLVPDHLKKQWQERLADHNPFKTISANHDLVRATRLAWIEAAQDILKEARALSAQSEWRSGAKTSMAFDATIRDILLDARDHALDRRKDPGQSPIDAHVQAVITGVPELVSPGNHIGIGATVTSRFTSVLAELSGWDAQEIPPVCGQLARNGLATHGGGPLRSFGELVFAAFAEIIKDPKKYPQAREAFYIAMDKLGRDIGQATLTAVQGLDVRLDAVIAGLDGLDVLRSGAIRYLELLPGIAEGVERLEEKVGVVAAAQDAFAHKQDQQTQILQQIAAHLGIPNGVAVLNSKVSQLETELHSTRADLISLLVDIVGRGITPDQIDGALRSAKDNLEKSRAELERLRGLTNEVPEIETDLAAARAALNNPQGIDLAEAKRAIRAARARYRATELARREGVAVNMARMTEAEASISLARSDFLKAAGLFAEAADELPEGDRVLAAEFRFRQGGALHEHGNRYPGLDSLQEAVVAYRGALSIYIDCEMFFEAAMTQGYLGGALQILGERVGGASGQATLGEAIKNLQGSLSFLTENNNPAIWSDIQTWLGNALRALGWSVGKTLGKEKLHEALAAFKATLRVRTLEKNPFGWAQSQHNIGNVYRVLGIWDSTKEGNLYLNEAITFLRSALTIRTERDYPYYWAITQRVLADALRRSASKDGDEDKFKASIATFHAALRVYSENQYPLQNSLTLTGLGNTLGAYGECMPGDAGVQLLRESASILQSTLNHLTKKSSPYDLAVNQTSLGQTFLSLALRETGQKRASDIQSAIHCFRLSLGAFDQDVSPDDWKRAATGLATALKVRWHHLTVAKIPFGIVPSAIQLILFLNKSLK